MPKAFISYAREDKRFVDEHVRPTLAALNIDVWMDTENLHGAERWRETIQQAMTECDLFLVAVTPFAAASPAVRGEVEWILAHRDECLIPILAANVRLDGVHAELPNLHHVDCINKAPGRSAAYISRAIIHLLDRRAAKFKSQKEDLSALLESKQLENEELERELSALNSQMDHVLQFDGDWDRPPLGSVAPFVPRSDRRSTVVAIMNVKGGVGKSTLAANLAATWWGRAKSPKKVLLVDLDFQQSVSSLCLGSKDLNDLRAGNLFVNSLFDERIPATEHLFRSMRRVGRGDGYVLAADEKLTRVETQAMARWLTQQTTKDVRYRLREILQGPAVQEKFDLVVIDCPPRIHTASINALAAADFLLIPVLLDLTSADSVPRMLKWVRHYMDAGVCPNIEILGVIANKKSDRRNDLLAREENIWTELPGKCRVAWGGEVPFCSLVIPNSAAIAESTQTPGRFACEDSRMKKLFEELANKFEQQMSLPVEMLT